QRIGRRAIGFGAPHTRVERKAVSETLKHLQPQDLLKYGFIPEFIGRLPIIVTLHHLDQQDIVRILTEPKNALVKQYQKFFSLDKWLVRPDYPNRSPGCIRRWLNSAGRRFFSLAHRPASGPTSRAACIALVRSSSFRHAAKRR